MNLQYCWIKLECLRDKDKAFSVSYYRDQITVLRLNEFRLTTSFSRNIGFNSLA